MMIDWQEFEQKVRYIEELYAQYHLSVKQGEGLAALLFEANSLAKGIKQNEDEANYKKAIEAFHYVWMLQDSLETCIKAGWDISNHLKCINTGRVDYGVPKIRSNKEIYFKDFETELLIGATLLKHKKAVELLDDPSDPRGDLKSINIFIEVKHPDSIKQLPDLLKEFNNQMVLNKSFGIFTVGIEDIFNYGDKFFFGSTKEFEGWKCHKLCCVEKYFSESLPKTKACTNILGMITTSTKIYNIDDSSKLWRLGNSVQFIRDNVPNVLVNTAVEVIKCFNPNPYKYQF